MLSRPETPAADAMQTNPSCASRRTKPSGLRSTVSRPAPVGAVTNRLLPGQRPFLRRVANAEKPYRERDGSKLRTSSQGQALRHLRLGQPYRSAPLCQGVVVLGA